MICAYVNILWAWNALVQFASIIVSWLQIEDGKSWQSVENSEGLFFHVLSMLYL